MTLYIYERNRFFIKSKNVYDFVSELTEEEQNLMNHAIEARNKAYAPYSKFKVGAALLA